MQEVDVNLADVLRLKLSKNATDDQCTVQYLCNLPFADVLNTLSSDKFPGTMVSTLCRANIPDIVGNPAVYLSYKPAEIFAWLQPAPRAVPTLHFNRKKRRKVQGTVRDKKVVIHFRDVTFGQGGYFDFVSAQHELSSSS
jgi:hypothetical protein